MKTIILIILIAISGIININTQKPVIAIDKQQSAVNLNNNFISVFDLGQKRLISSLLWITTLIESDIEHYGGKDLKSWLYLRFNTIAYIDPLFLMNYQFGGLYLSIVKDDLIGAEDIFLKGLKQYPNDYKLNYNLGFLYAIEQSYYKKAIPYLEKVKDDPRAPRFLESLIIKVKHEVTNNKELSFKLLEDLYKKTEAQAIKDKVFVEMYQLKALIDLECLNSQKRNCDEYDLNQQPYLKDKSGIYFSQTPINNNFGVNKK